jgi:dipeptidyl aminopeptidase/acylaminoacyl peptidase
LVALVASGAGAQSVRSEHGNVIYRSAAGGERPLTTSGLDSSAVLSPDGGLVAFVRATPDRLVETIFDPEQVKEIWVVDTAGLASRLLVRGHTGTSGSDFNRTTLTSLRNLSFSPDGSRVFFESTAAATSGALHAVDVRNGRERFVAFSNGYEVLQAPPLRGSLLIWQHWYYAASGSYESVNLCSPTGKLIAFVTEDGAPDADRRLAAARAGRPLPNKRPR